MPNLQSRVPIHSGQGLGLSFYTLGQVGGAEGVVLNVSQMGPHTHSAACGNATGNSITPGAAQWAASTLGDNTYTTGAATGAAGRDTA